MGMQTGKVTAEAMQAVHGEGDKVACLLVCKCIASVSKQVPCHDGRPVADTALLGRCEVQRGRRQGPEMRVGLGAVHKCLHA